MFLLIPRFPRNFVYVNFHLFKQNNNFEIGSNFVLIDTARIHITMYLHEYPPRSSSYGWRDTITTWIGLRDKAMKAIKEDCRKLIEIGNLDIKLEGLRSSYGQSEMLMPFLFEGINLTPMDHYKNMLTYDEKCIRMFNEANEKKDREDIAK